METTSKKWYQSKSWIYILSIFIPPIGFYQLWKSKDFATKTKIAVTLIVSALFILGGIGMIKSSQFNQKLLSDGELYIHFQESNAGTNPDVKFYFRFYKNQIVDFRSNVIRYSATANFDTRFTEILQSGSIFQVRTKTNTGSYGDPDWDIKMTIDINAIGGYKEPKDSLKGTV